MDTGTGTASGADFRIFSDRSASDLEAFEWNSTMDLLACLTAAPDSTMSIYRLLSEDQSPKLLSEKITGVGTTLAWSPCGRRLVVGDRLGGITMFDGETGSVLHSRRSHSAPVAAFCWMDGKYMVEEPAWSRMLPPLLTVPSAPSNMYAETQSRDEEWTSNFTILASIDEAGQLILAAGGTFPLQATDLNEEETFQHLRSRGPMAIELSTDLRCLAVLLGPGGKSIRSPENPHVRTPLPQTPNQGNSPQGWSASGRSLAVAVLDVRKFAMRRKELAQCSSMVERFCAVASYTQQAVDTLATVWKSAASGFINKIRAMTDCIQAYAGAGSCTISSRDSVQSELLFTLCTGNPSDAMHAFLTRQTTPQQLSRIEKTLMQALDYVNLVTCSRLQVAVQHLLAILQELKAYANWIRFSSIGLDLGLLEELELRVMKFSGLTEQLLIDSSHARRFARTLFHLLLYQAQKLTEGNEATGTPSSRVDTASCSAPNPSDVEGFLARQQSLELHEVTMRIGNRTKSSPPPAVAGSSGEGLEDPEASLASQVAELVALSGGLGQRICQAMARQSAPLLCESLAAPPPWCCVSSPELRAVASADAASWVPSPRGLGRPIIHMVWEDLSTDKGHGVKETLPEQLLLLWCGGDPPEAHGLGSFSCLHLARIHLPIGRFGNSIQPTLQLAKLKANSILGKANRCI